MTTRPDPLSDRPRNEGATVTPYAVDGKRRYRAWCNDHQDGYQGGKQGATSWAGRHNAEQHGGDK